MYMYANNKVSIYLGLHNIKSLIEYQRAVANLNCWKER